MLLPTVWTTRERIADLERSRVVRSRVFRKIISRSALERRSFEKIQEEGARLSSCARHVNTTDARLHPRLITFSIEVKRAERREPTEREREEGKTKRIVTTYRYRTIKGNRARERCTCRDARVHVNIFRGPSRASWIVLVRKFDLSNLNREKTDSLSISIPRYPRIQFIFSVSSSKRSQLRYSHTYCYV